MERSGIAHVLLMAGLSLLAACSTPQMSQPQPAPMAVSPAPPPVEIPPPPVAEPVPVPQPMAEVPPPPAPMPVPLPTPTDALSLRAAFGTPAFVRREADSELWRYDGANCAAFFFLYRDGESLRIRYSETAPRGQNQPADPDCLRSLIGPRGGAAAGARMS